MVQAATNQPSQQIRIIIVDDHHIFRQGVQVNLELQSDIQVIGQGANGEQGLAIVRQMQPDVVIMDINLPIMNGIQVTRQLAAEGQPSRVIMLTAYDDTQQVIHAMRAGAAAYCAKEIEPDKLVEVIRQVVQGRYILYEQVFDKAGIEEWLEHGMQAVAGPYYLDTDESFSPLSPREMEILQCVTRGLSNKEIAQALQISHQTVKNHMTSILRKLTVEDRTQAAVFALRRGWVRLKDSSESDND
ncbi:MAG: response regulator transcription factor [Anaerolineae bacterium]|nr:response regulator transcription factor [Anaerolineae bacterium]